MDERENNQTPPPIDRNSYECSICGKRYPSRLTVVRHEMEDHDTPGPSNANANRPLSDKDDDNEQEAIEDLYSGKRLVLKIL